MTIPEEDADVGQGSKYCLVAIGRLQVMPVFSYVNYFRKHNQCYGLVPPKHNVPSCLCVQSVDCLEHADRTN